MMENINVWNEAKKLANLPWDTDSRDWKIMSEIIYNRQDYDLWMQICQLALVFCEKIIVKAWLLLEYVNGLRRKGGNWDIELAVHTLDNAKLLIDNLPQYARSRQDRLLELRSYHAGWVYHPAGQFLKSAESHKVSADIAGDKRSVKLALHNMHYEFLNAAIIANDQEGINSCYKRFTQANEELLQFLSNSDEDIRWRANVYCHQMWYDWLIRELVPGKEEIEDFKTHLLQVKIEPASDNGLITLQAISVLKQPVEAVKIASRINIEGRSDWRTYVMLVHALALDKLGQAEKAKLKRREILDLQKSEHGGHLAEAIITHNLFGNR